MTALVRGVALGVTPDPPEAETYTVGQRVTWCNPITGITHPARVVEVWADCYGIHLDCHAHLPVPRVYEVPDDELRPIDTPASRTTT